MKYPVNRVCPLSGEQPARIWAYLPAGAICAANPTYRPNFAEILDISADDEFPIVEGRAGFVFAGWSPPNDFLKKVYEDLIDHSKTSTETVGYRRSLMDFGANFFRTIEKMYGSSTRPLRLLDFGCGYGTLSRMLNSRDVECYGYEPSGERRLAASRGGLTVLDNLDAAEAAGPFDLFICTEVLEHVPRPRDVLRFLKKNASPGALLAITVPPCDKSFFVESLASYSRDGHISRTINPWEHLNYFSSKSLTNLLKEEGFEVVQDYGRARQAYEYFLQIGNLPRLKHRVLAALRLAKMLTVRPSSTELICRSV